jgi:hypothetical protein
VLIDIIWQKHPTFVCFRLSMDSEILPCLSDIIMNRRAPETSAKAIRTDCKRGITQVRDLFYCEKILNPFL